MSYSERVGGGSHKYYLAQPEETAAAITSGLHDLPSEHDELLRLIHKAQGSPNIRLLELAARAQILLGDTEGARTTTVAATRQLEEPIYDWDLEVQKKGCCPPDDPGWPRLGRYPAPHRRTSTTHRRRTRVVHALAASASRRS